MDEIKKDAVRVGVIAGVAFFAGGGLAYYLTKRHLTLKFNEHLEAEIRRTKDFYARTYKAEQYSTPESAVDSLVGDAADAMRAYRGEDENIPDAVIVEEEVEIRQNVFVDHAVDEDFANDDLDKENRSREKPYLIDIEEWNENEPEHDQLTFAYYAGDNVLADERDKEVADVESIVGHINIQMFGSGSNDPNTVMVRNERLNLDIEIVKSDGRYAHEVLGFDVEDSLEHSDDSMRRRRPRGDDD